MKTIREYLADYAAATGCTSDYQISKKLGVTKQAVSLYRTGRSAPGIEVCWQISDTLSLPLGAVIAAAEVERAKCANDPQRAALWRARLSSVSAHAGKVFSLVALVPVAVWNAADCILCQIAGQLSGHHAITLPVLRYR